ncbi:hypothetical protein L0222_31605, partial [bacterium]|nr:hypothetical protein [bacterium]
MDKGKRKPAIWINKSSIDSDQLDEFRQSFKKFHYDSGLVLSSGLSSICSVGYAGFLGLATETWLLLALWTWGYALSYTIAAGPMHPWYYAPFYLGYLAL